MISSLLLSKSKSSDEAVIQSQAVLDTAFGKQKEIDHQNGD